ncbi:MAG: hypothetical protein M9948_11230 [Lentimicrobium sp.]|nr:hypothetical protein [Lentimicrobium sp.]
MVAIVLGIIVLLVGFILGGVDSPIKRYVGTVKVIGIVLLVLGAAFSAVYQIEPGQVGVQKLFGKSK